MQKVIVALVQFDAVPEQIEQNLGRMTSLVEDAVCSGARWVVFHENCVCDYTPRVAELAEPVPDGESTQRMAAVARELDCIISFGLLEKNGGRFHITQVFVGPEGMTHSYRKTWLHNDPENKGHRDEWACYDPGTGPELFEVDGVTATCFICADGKSRRCIARAAELKPQIVFYPTNMANPPDFPVFGQRARAIAAPMLVANRVGDSWVHPCIGGCVVYSATGEVLASANREGREEILLHELELPG